MPMLKTSHWCLLLTALVVCLPARAEEPRVVACPVVADGLGFAELKLGNETLQMAVDTGATYTLVDARFRHHLGHLVGRANAQTANSTRTISFYEGKQGWVGGYELNEPAVPCVDLGPDLRGEGVDGLLGMSFLSRYCVDFDWNASQVRIWEHAPEKIPDPHVEVALGYNPRRMPVVTLAAGSASGLAMAIDTGSTQSLALSAADAAKVFPMGWGKSIESVAMTADKHTRSLEVRVPLVDIQGLKSRDVLANVEVPDSKAGEARTSQIGCGLLHRYRAIFDFPNGKLTLVERAPRPRTKPT